MCIRDRVPTISVAGTHCMPLNFNTCPFNGAVLLTAVLCILLTTGFGKEPVKSPPAVPFGGNEIGITPAASLALVTEASTIFEVVIALSASLVEVIAPLL